MSVTSHSGQVDFSQLEAFLKNTLNPMAKSLDKALMAWAKEKANEILTKAKKRTPVDTGRLLASWQEPVITKDGNSITITFENTAQNAVAKEYGGYVEYGHNDPYHGGEPVNGEHWNYGHFMLTVPIQEFYDEVGNMLGADLVTQFGHDWNTDW